MIDTTQNSEQILNGQVMPAVRMMLGNPELVEANTKGMEVNPQLRESLTKYFENDKELQSFVDAMLGISTDQEKREALEDYLAGKISPEIVGFDPERFLKDTAEKVATQKRIGVKPTVTRGEVTFAGSETPAGSQTEYELKTEDQIKTKTKSNYEINLGTNLRIGGLPFAGLSEIRVRGKREVDIPSQIGTAKAPEIPAGRQEATIEREKKKRTSDGGETVNEQQAEQQNIAQQQQQAANQTAGYLAAAQATAAAAQAKKRAEKGMSGMAKAGMATGLGVGTIVGGFGAYTLLDIL